MLICVCLRILASSRIPQYDLGRQTPHFEVVLSQPTPIVCFEHRRLFSLDKISRGAVVSPVSGEGCHHACVSHFPSAWLVPHLLFISLTYKDDAGSSPALTSRPPPSECHRVSLSLQPHRRPTSSVSRAAILLAQHTPLVARVPVSPITPQGSHR
jgi:hypothetical protein